MQKLCDLTFHFKFIQQTDDDQQNLNWTTNEMIQPGKGQLQKSPTLGLETSSFSH
jgi:hypothetical protein